VAKCVHKSSRLQRSIPSSQTFQHTTRATHIYNAGVQYLASQYFVSSTQLCLRATMRSSYQCSSSPWYGQASNCTRQSSRVFELVLFTDVRMLKDRYNLNNRWLALVRQLKLGSDMDIKYTCGKNEYTEEKLYPAARRDVNLRKIKET
jgi:hypothetical protein